MFLYIHVLRKFPLSEPTPEPCTAVCENGGTCVKDTIKGDRCDCPQEFAGAVLDVVIVIILSLTFSMHEYI